VAEWLGRGLQSLVQRFESARRLLFVVALALGVAACATEAERAQPPSSDAEQLVPQVSDLPAGYNLVPAESSSVSLETVLAEPWSAGIRGTIERDRVSGYRVTFSSPTAERVQCSAGLYRSESGGAVVFRARMDRFTQAFDARPLTIPAIGEETRAHHYRVGGQLAVTVSWRFRHVLSSCTAVGPEPELNEVLVVARAQQARIARTLAEGRR
jgi:hypothetical protein